MKEQLKELLKSVDPKILTEDVVTKLDGIFEAAVAAQVSTLKEEIENQLTEEVKTELSEFKEEMINKVDSWLTMFADNFLMENVDVLENEMKVQSYEKLLKGIGQIFETVGLALPNSGETISESVSQKNKELKERVNMLVEENLALQEDNLRQAGLRVWAEETNDLSAENQEKLRTLMEDVDFETAEDLPKKIRIMREGFLNTKKEGHKEDEHPLNEDAASSKRKESVSQFANQLL